MNKHIKIPFSMPSNLIGLVGLFPIAIGIKELLELCKNKQNDKDDEELHRDNICGARRYWRICLS
jgi:cadmium resistance protein CadD (predicted permease)